MAGFVDDGVALVAGALAVVGDPGAKLGDGVGGFEADDGGGHLFFDHHLIEEIGDVFLGTMTPFLAILTVSDGMGA